MALVLPTRFPSRIVDSAQFQAMQTRLVEWLTTGLTPRRLAFTLSLGFAIGCIPVLGVTTGICALMALALGLNMPAIQAANWLAMPFQVVLLIPFLRFGQWLFPGSTNIFDPRGMNRVAIQAQMTAAPWRTVEQMGSMFGHAILAWLIAATPALLLLTLVLTPVMRRVSRRVAVSDILAGD